MNRVLKTFFLGAAALAAAADNSSWASETWDVIVIGAGAAGIVVADRMSEAGKKTLLLEGGGSSYAITGGTESPAWLDGSGLSRVDVPGLYKSIFSDQGDLTCQNYTNAFVGCTVGGSTAINAGLFFQPPASDFDDYFPAGWQSKDVSASIQKVYDSLNSSDVYSKNHQFYVQSGYTAAQKWLVGGGGFAEVDLNAEANNKSKVFGRPIFDYNNGQRGGPATTYLQNALQRDNFHLQTNTRVWSIARDNDTATGVVLSADKSTVKLAAGGRVIVSGGAMQSPQILMYSGIGDPSLQSGLVALGVLKTSDGWINNTAVGAGLFDNPNTFIEFSGPSIQSYVYNYTNPIEADAQMYLNSRSGPYSFASETSAFWDYIDGPDGSKIGCQGTIDSAGFSDFMSNNTITLNVYGTSGMKSSGHVVLDAKGLPGNSPDVYYSNPQDAEAIAQFIFNIFQSLNESDLTPLNMQANWTQAEIQKYITSSTAYTGGSVQHWSSSCRIGSCVDENTQVVGTTNIHVVDASILMPLTVNPQFGTMIAAERASELILTLKNSSVPASSSNGTTPATASGTATSSGTASSSSSTSAPYHSSAASAASAASSAMERSSRAVALGSVVAAIGFSIMMM